MKLQSMRSILTISLPEEEKKKIQQKAKKAGKTISTYVIHALKISEDLIQDDEIISMTKKAEKDFKEGKTKKLKSLADLL